MHKINVGSLSLLADSGEKSQIKGMGFFPQCLAYERNISEAEKKQRAES